jgi:hypothetical protein
MIMTPGAWVSLGELGWAQFHPRSETLMAQA